MASDQEIRVIETWIGATARKLRFQVRDKSTLAPLDLSNVENAYVSARIKGAATYQISSAQLTIEVGTDGWAYFYPTSAEVNTAGDFFANIKLMYETTLDYAEEMIIRIKEPNDAHAEV